MIAGAFNDARWLAAGVVYRLASYVGRVSQRAGWRLDRVAMSIEDGAR